MSTHTQPSEAHRHLAIKIASDISLNWPSCTPRVAQLISDSEARAVEKAIAAQGMPVLTPYDGKAAERIVTLITENLGAVPTEEEAIREVLQDPSLTEAVALEVNEATTAALTAERERSATLAERVKVLTELLEDFISNDSTPRRNCSCHISPPCNDCVENEGKRELVAQATRVLALAATEGKT